MKKVKLKRATKEGLRMRKKAYLLYKLRLLELMKEEKEYKRQLK